MTGAGRRRRRIRRSARDKRGWHVSPAPDGRGAARGASRSRRTAAAWFLWFVVGLLALNWISCSRSSRRARPGDGPLQPVLPDRPSPGQVKSIGAKADAVEGTFKTKVRYPAHSKSATPTTLFATQVPAFWNNSQLAAELESRRRRSRRSRRRRRAVLEELLLGFGPTLLIVGIFVLIFRRARQGRRRDGRARRVRPLEGATRRSDDIPVTFADVAGIDEAKAELTEIVDFLRNPTLRAPRRPDAARRAALGRARYRQDAARARLRRRGPRRVLLDIGLGVHRGDRRRRRIARP